LVFYIPKPHHDELQTSKSALARFLCNLPLLPLSSVLPTTPWLSFGTAQATTHCNEALWLVQYLLELVHYALALNYIEGFEVPAEIKVGMVTTLVL
jgi:hypothetical protein